jgi:SSS family solute:Na+ symporter
VGAVVSLISLLVAMPQGPGQVMQIALQHDKFSLGSFALSFAEPTFWVVLLYGLAENLRNFGVTQSYVQCYITAKSDRAARNSVWLAAALYIPLSAVFFFIGTALFAFYTAHPGLLPASIAAEPDKIFPH